MTVARKVYTAEFKQEAVRLAQRSVLIGKIGTETNRRHRDHIYV